MASMFALHISASASPTLGTLYDMQASVWHIIYKLLIFAPKFTCQKSLCHILKITRQVLVATNYKLYTLNSFNCTNEWVVSERSIRVCGWWWCQGLYSVMCLCTIWPRGGNIMLSKERPSLFQAFVYSWVCATPTHHAFCGRFPRLGSQLHGSKDPCSQGNPRLQLAAQRTPASKPRVERNHITENTEGIAKLALVLLKRATLSCCKVTDKCWPIFSTWVQGAGRNILFVVCQIIIRGYTKVLNI